MTLKAAREKNILIHNTNNIRSAGDEVEVAVRDFLRRRLAKRCMVSQGHIVDNLGHISPQIDVVIHDGIEFPSLQENRDGTEYFPYESVYAIGEVKSTYTAANGPVQRFSRMIENDFKKKMQRNRTPIGYVPTGLGSGIDLGRSNNAHLSIRTYLNPLFTFMFFLDSGDFKIENIDSFYQNTSRVYLPNMLCFLDQGVVVLNKDPSTIEKYYQYELFPEFEHGNDWVWGFAPHAEQECLALTWSILEDALSDIVLMRPHYLNYAQRVFEIDDKQLQTFGKKADKEI